MKKSFFFLAFLYGFFGRLTAQEIDCLPFVTVPLEISDSTCQAVVSPFQVLTGDLQNLDEGNFVLIIFDSNPNNLNVMEGPGPFDYEIQCVGLDFPPCGDFTECAGQIAGLFPAPEITSDAASICPAANSGGNTPGGTQDCEKICVGSTVTYTLQGDSLSSIEAVQVSGSDNFTIFDNRVEVTWEAAGFGSVSLLAAGPCGTEQEAFICTEVLDNPTANFKTLPEAEGDTLFICQGQPLQFLNNSQAAETFFWSFGDGNTAAEAQPNYLYEQPGTYTATLSAYNECECVDEARLTIVVEEGEVPIVDCVGTLCAGQIGTYEAATDCSTYTWSIAGNGTVIDGGGPQDDFISVEWHEGPAGTVFLEVGDCPDPSGCISTFEAQVPILADTIAINGPAKVCRSEVGVYSIAPYEGTAMTWSVSNFGNIVQGQGTNEIVVQWAGSLASAPQWVAVELDNCYLGCLASDTLPVNMAPGLYLDAPLEACFNDTIQVQTQALPAGGPVVANLAMVNALGDTVFTTGTPSALIDLPTTVPAGLYQLVATPAGPEAYCQAEAAGLLRVLAEVPPVDSLLGPTNICPGQSYTFEAIEPIPGTQFHWEITDGNNTYQASGERINITFGDTPPYQVSVRRANLQGCTSGPRLRDLFPLPSLEINGPDASCQQEINTYTVAAFQELDYQWSISPAGAGTIISENGRASVDISWHYTGLATLTVEACDQIAIAQVAINPLPEPVALHPDVLCPEAAGPVQTSAAFDSYLWLNEDNDLVSLNASPDLGPGFYRVVVTDFNGCAEDTSFVIRSHETPSVHLSTPDPNGFCGPAPSTRLFSTDSEAGYAFQWLQDGNPVGPDDDLFTATAFGLYQVSVTDQNGCTNISNPIAVVECSSDSAVVAPNQPCTGQITLQASGNGTCNERAYEAITSPNYIAGSGFWSFDDPGSGASNTAAGSNIAAHTFSSPGYYRIVFGGSFVDPATGSPANCLVFQPDTIYAVARFQADTVCAGSATSFTDLSTFLDGANIDSWSWDFGDPSSGAANTSALPDPQHTYQNPGTYNASLTITSSGCTSTFARAVEVKDRPAISFAPPAINCAEAAVQFDAIEGPDVTEVFWSFGDPGSGEANAAEGTIAYHRYDSPGTYTVSVTAIGRFGCDRTFSQDITIDPNPLSGAIQASGTAFCAGDSALLTAPPGGEAWDWNNGGTTESIWVTETGNYTLTITDSNGCTYVPDRVELAFTPTPEDLIRAVVYDALGQPVSYVYDTLEVCEGTDVFLETLANPDYSYTWPDGSPTASVEFSEDRGNLLMAGTYTYEVTVTENTSGCTHVEGPFTVMVNPAPEVQISQSPGGFVCEGTPVTFSVDNPDPALAYRWSNGEEGPVMETSQPGRYTVAATNSFGCEGESNTLQIEPGPDISLVPNGCYSRCRPDTLCLPEIPGISTYQWVFEGMPLSPPSSTVPELIATESGNYWLDMVADNGCALSSDPLQLELFDGLSQLGGQVYIDVNDNGLIDAADTTYGGAAIELLQNNNLLSTAVATTDNGYTFPNLPAGDYQLQLDTAQLPQELVPVYTEIDTTTFGCFLAFPADWLLQVDCTPDTTTFSIAGCDSVVYEGVTYLQDTVWESGLSGFWGCDSLVQVGIDVLQPTAGTLQAGACENEAFDFQGTLVPAGTQQDFTLVNTAGCDSILTVVVETLEPTDSTLSFAACQGESVDYLGTPVPAGAQQDFTFTNANGCDSVVTVAVETLLPSDSTLSFAACQGESVDYLGTPVPAGAQQDFTFTNANGCDSVVTVAVETLLPTDSTLSFAACQGESVDYLGTPVPAGAQQDFTFTNANGCDSVVTVAVETLLPTDSTLSFAACQGESVDYLGTPVPAGAQQDFTFTNANGCDSVVTVAVETLLPTDSTLSFAACQGESVDYLGTPVPAGAQQDFTFTNANGCDSVVTVAVETLLPTDTTLKFSTCEAGGVTYQGVEIMAGSSQQFVLSNSNGCDSIVTVEVEGLPALSEDLLLSVCEGATVDYQGTTLSAGQDTTFLFTSAAGCDSLVNVQVETIMASVTTVPLEACSGDSAMYNGQSLPAGDTLQLLLTNAAGCDSIVLVPVAALSPPTVTVVTQPACPGQPDGELLLLTGGTPGLTYILNGMPPQINPSFTGLEAGNYEIQVEYAAGCQTLVQATVESLPPLEAELAVSPGSCENPVTNVGAIILSGSETDVAYNWSNGADGPVTQFEQSGQGTLLLSNECENLELNFEIRPPSVDREAFLFIPSAFSPNGDDNNDLFQVYPAPGVEWQSFQLQVFDRWGNQLHEHTTPNDGWDGTFKGTLMNTGLYVYQLKGTVNYCGQELEVEREGGVMLVR